MADFKSALSEGFSKKDGTKVSGESLAGKTIAVYCSAHWCPPCRAFTPVLAKFYAEYKAMDPNFEIIFVSSDRSKEDMLSYFAEHGDYLCCDFDGKAKGALAGIVNSRGIPCLAIFNSEGEMITKDGRAAVTQGAAAVHSHGWAPGPSASTGRNGCIVL